MKYQELNHPDGLHPDIVIEDSEGEFQLFNHGLAFMGSPIFRTPKVEARCKGAVSFLMEENPALLKSVISRWKDDKKYFPVLKVFVRGELGLEELFDE